MVTLLRWKDVVRPGEAFHTARVTHNPRRAAPYHRHDFAEVFWVDAGRGVHRVNGNRQFLEPGTLVFVRPEDAHCFESPAQAGLRFTNIAFARAACDFLGERYFQKKGGGWWNRKMLPEVRKLSGAQLRMVNHRADELAMAPRTPFAIERFLMNLLAETEEQRPLPKEVPDWLAAACREIRQPENLAGGVRTFLKLAGRGREHVARSMRRYLSTSPTEYVNRVRMEHAAHLLEMSSRSILEIAADCGTENLSHFYKLFGEVHGSTPRAYRDAHRSAV